MPPDGRWPTSQVELFLAWQADGAPKRRGATYSDFFRDLDSYTEYWDLYRPETQGKYIKPVKTIIFPKVLGPWRSFAQAGPADVQAKKDALQAVLNQNDVGDAVKMVDQLLLSLVRQHFPSSGQCN